jgi:RNA polymerase-binding transcription factor DksA
MDTKQRQAQLLARRAVLRQRAGKIDDHLRQVDRELPQDWEDRATALENDEVLDALDATTRAELDEIQAALVRLEKGTYGRCEVCHKLIPEGRLAAIPTARRCTHCAA